MAMVIHTNGEQLSQTRAKAQANFLEVIAVHVEIIAAELVIVRSGMGLPAFRDACRINFEAIQDVVDGIGVVAGVLTIDDGDMLWTVRDKLNVNFALIAAA